MPCTHEETPAEILERQERQERRDTAYTDRINKLTRMLCSLCKHVEKLHPTMFGLIGNKELLDWWKEHKEFDRKRLEKERQEKIKKPVKDLSDDELEEVLKARREAKKNGCIFDIAWAGLCKSAVVEGHKFCSNHLKEKCRCGKQAVKQCSHAGQFVCGTPLCETCKCH